MGHEGLPWALLFSLSPPCPTIYSSYPAAIIFRMKLAKEVLSKMVEHGVLQVTEGQSGAQQYTAGPQADVYRQGLAV